MYTSQQVIAKSFRTVPASELSPGQTKAIETATFELTKFGEWLGTVLPNGEFKDLAILKVLEAKMAINLAIVHAGGSVGQAAYGNNN